MVLVRRLSPVPRMANAFMAGRGSFARQRVCLMSDPPKAGATGRRSSTGPR
jgi:hypothetical protein